MLGYWFGYIGVSCDLWWFVSLRCMVCYYVGFWYVWWLVVALWFAQTCRCVVGLLIAGLFVWFAGFVGSLVLWLGFRTWHNFALFRFVFIVIVLCWLECFCWGVVVLSCGCLVFVVYVLVIVVCLDVVIAYLNLRVWWGVYVRSMHCDSYG